MLNDLNLYHQIPVGWIWLVPIVFVFGVIIFALKGYTLWKSAKRGEVWWFIALFVLNTAGILELIYIVFVLKKYHVSFAKKMKTHMKTVEAKPVTPTVPTPEVPKEEK